MPYAFTTNKGRKKNISQCVKKEEEIYDAINYNLLFYSFISQILLIWNFQIDAKKGKWNLYRNKNEHNKQILNSLSNITVL